jgi:hypothetical protein
VFAWNLSSSETGTAEVAKSSNLCNT